jgi:TPR repeat protein
MNSLGCYYYNGTVVARDYNEAFRWFKKSADAGHSSAQYNMGLCYEFGRCVTKNIPEAKRWYQKAADNGDTMAKEKLRNL